MSISAITKAYEKARKQENKNADTDSMTDTASGLPKGLVPSRTFDGIYTTGGDGTFDPRDCSNPRNATSPWCGYNPVSSKPLDVGLSAKVTKCGIVAKFAPTIGFIEFPPVNVAYVNEECRDAIDNVKFKPVPAATPEVPLPDVTPPDQQSYAFNPSCDYIIGLDCNNPAGGGMVELQPYGTHFYKYEVKFDGSTVTFYSNSGNAIESQTDTNLNLRGMCFFVNNYPLYSEIWDNYRAQEEFNITRRSDQLILKITNYYQLMQGYGRTANYWQPGWFPGKPINYIPKNISRELPYFRYSINMRDVDLPLLAVAGIQNPTWSAITNKMAPRSGNSWAKSSCFYLAKGGSIIEWLNTTTFKGEWGDGSPNGIQYTVGFKQELQCANSLKYRLPSDDCHPKNAENCCDSQNANCYGEEEMGCCEDKNKDINAKLDKILKNQGKFPVSVSVWDDDPNAKDRQKANKNLGDISTSIDHLNKQLQRTMQILGIEEFPVTYPDSLIEPVAMNAVEKLWSWLNPKKDRKIVSIAQLIDWGFDQMSATTGQFHQYVEYEDDKKKTQKISLPDIATTLRELFKMQSSIIQIVGLQTDIELKTLQESTNASLMVAEALKRITDVQDYLDYPTREVQSKLPVQITPRENIKNIKQYLKGSELVYKFDDWTPDQGQSLQEQLNEIRLILNALRANQGGERY